MTLVACPNLAIDRVVAAGSLRAGHQTRCRALVQQAGGKGANVVRASQTLRGARDDDLLVGFNAGHNGRLYAALAADEGIRLQLVESRGETRISTVILTDDGKVTPLFERGFVIENVDEQRYLAALTQLPRTDGEWAIVNGASPPGASPGFFAAIVERLRTLGYRVLVDAAGEQLAGSLAARPEFVKINRYEAADVVAGVFHDDEPVSELGGEAPPAPTAELVKLARRLTEIGPRSAVVTAGASGAVAFHEGSGWRTVGTPLPVAGGSPIGSGDCFAAGFVSALEAGAAFAEALSLGAGAGAANVVNPLTAHFVAHQARQLAAATATEPVNET